MRIGLIKQYFRNSSLADAAKASFRRDPLSNFDKAALEARVEQLYKEHSSSSWFECSKKAAIRSTLKDLISQTKTNEIARILTAEGTKFDGVSKSKENVTEQDIERRANRIYKRHKILNVPEIKTVLCNQSFYRSALKSTTIIDVNGAVQEKHFIEAKSVRSFARKLEKDSKTENEQSPAIEQVQDAERKDEDLLISPKNEIPVEMRPLNAPTPLDTESNDIEEASTQAYYSIDSQEQNVTIDDIRYSLTAFSAKEANFLCNWLKSLTYAATADQIIMREQPNRPMEEMKKRFILKLLDLIKPEKRSMIYKLSADASLDPTVLAGLIKEQKTLFSIVQTL